MLKENRSLQYDTIIVGLDMSVYNKITNGRMLDRKYAVFVFVLKINWWKKKKLIYQINIRVHMTMCNTEHYTLLHIN